MDPKMEPTMEEIVGFLAGQALSLALGFAGGWLYHRYRLWRIKRDAPSAEVVSFHVSLTQEDYDRLPKKEDDVQYAIVDRANPPD